MDRLAFTSTSVKTRVPNAASRTGAMSLSAGGSVPLATSDPRYRTLEYSRAKDGGETGFDLDHEWLVCSQPFLNGRLYVGRTAQHPPTHSESSG